MIPQKLVSHIVSFCQIIIFYTQDLGKRQVVYYLNMIFPLASPLLLLVLLSLQLLGVSLIVVRLPFLNRFLMVFPMIVILSCMCTFSAELLSNSNPRAPKKNINTKILLKSLLYNQSKRKIYRQKRQEAPAVC